MGKYENGWYVLYTKPKHEKKVAEKLQQNHLTYYLPMMSAVRKWADRMKVVQTPMFPSYIFIYLHNLNEYYSPLTIEGVMKYVKFDSQLARVPDATIEKLKLISKYNGEVEVSLNEFRQGTMMTVSDGPFAGINCEVVQYKNQEKILVRLGLLQRNVLIEMPVNKLVKVGNAISLLSPQLL